MSLDRQAGRDKPVGPRDAQSIDSAALAAAATAAAIAVFIESGPFVPLNGILGVTLILLLLAYELDRPRTGLQHWAFGAVSGLCCLLVIGPIYELYLHRWDLSLLTNQSMVSTWKLITAWCVSGLIFTGVGIKRARLANPDRDS